MHEQVGDLHIAFLTDLCRNRVQGSLASNGGTIANTGFICLPFEVDYLYN